MTIARRDEGHETGRPEHRHQAHSQEVAQKPRASPILKTALRPPDPVLFPLPVPYVPDATLATEVVKRLVPTLSPIELRVAFRNILHGPIRQQPVVDFLTEFRGSPTALVELGHHEFTIDCCYRGKHRLDTTGGLPCSLVRICYVRVKIRKSSPDIRH